jgi:hypothetical protein
MAETRLSDIIIPEVFLPYVKQETMEKSALFTSGLVQEDARVAVGTRAGGETIHMPFWNELDGDAEEISDTKDLTVGALTTGQDIAVAQYLGKAFGHNDLVGLMTGDDPAGQIASGVAKFWERNMQKRIVSSLKGVFASTSMASNLLDISGGTGAAAVIDKFSFADAQFKLGDEFGALTAVAMHSHTYKKLYKDDLLETIKPSEGAPYVTYQGKRVFVDDTLPVTSGVYTTYLFGPGAIGYAEGTPAELALEFDRNSLGGYDVMIMRRLMVLHPRGVKYTGASISAGNSTSGRPNATDLSTADNWTRVYDAKNIRIVAMNHKVA